MLVGYHIMPNALICLLVARLIGAQAVYQMTGGPIQLIGGGFESENSLLRRVGKPSPLRERLMFSLVREFDCVVVRGKKAQEFVKSNRLAKLCRVLPGSVDCSLFSPVDTPKVYDVVSVGRLVPIKRTDRVLEIGAILAGNRPEIRISLVGDGPLMTDLRRQATRMNLSSNIEFLGRRDDVAGILRRCKLFLITSQNEGLSIAMIEAMAAGVIPVVPDVGELRDLVTDGENGLVIDPRDPLGAAVRIQELLESPDRQRTMSVAARRAVMSHCDVPAVAARWKELLEAPEFTSRQNSPASPGEPFVQLEVV
jgi:glycosyltransferase involved in cell wall biosynthesis